MKTLQAVLGYIVAALMAPLVIAVLMFIQQPGANDAIVAATGLTLADEIDGGDVVQTIDHGAYQTDSVEQSRESDRRGCHAGRNPGAGRTCRRSQRRSVVGRSLSSVLL